jgi:hypothetical protein
MSTTRLTAAFAFFAAAAALATAPASVAKDGDVRATGICTKSSAAKLKLSDEDGRIEVEFEVDQNRNGVPWRVAVRRNGALVASPVAITRAPSGSFTVRRLVANLAGADRVVAVGTSPSGERCRVVAAF